MIFFVNIHKKGPDTKAAAQVVEATVECEYGVVLQALATFMNQVGGSHEEKRDWNSIVRLVDDRVQSAVTHQPRDPRVPTEHLTTEPKIEYSERRPDDSFTGVTDRVRGGPGDPEGDKG